MIVVGIISILYQGFPILFAHERLGKDGRPFTMIKFRTMESGKSLSAEHDIIRLTPWGRVLRRTSIDELPVLFNVIKGDMSLVGPRPEIPNLVKLYAEEIPHFKLRNLIRPGITGWAQIKQGHTSGIEEAKKKLEYDLYYLKHANLTVDLTVLIHTIKVLLCGSERNLGSSDH